MVFSLAAGRGRPVGAEGVAFRSRRTVTSAMPRGCWTWPSGESKAAISCSRWAVTFTLSRRRWTATSSGSGGCTLPLKVDGHVLRATRLLDVAAGRGRPVRAGVVFSCSRWTVTSSVPRGCWMCPLDVAVQRERGLYSPAQGGRPRPPCHAAAGCGRWTWLSSGSGGRTLPLKVDIHVRRALISTVHSRCPAG